MASTFFGLNIATSGMQAYQISLNTTAHNISNIATEGYSKQDVKLSASQPISVTAGYGMIGSGVQVNEIYREHNDYFDTKYRYNKAISGEYNTKEYYLDCIQGRLYSSDSDVGGITTSFDKFYASLTTLTSEASDMTKRTDSAVTSESFAQYVGDFANTLQSLQDEANTQIGTVVKQINNLGKEIAGITNKINTFEISGEKANDLRDARNALLDKLSEYANITAVEKEAKDGGSPQFLVYLDGAMMVDTTQSYELQCVASKTKDNVNDIDGLYNLQWENGQSFNMRSATLGGTLQALLHVRDGNNAVNFAGTASSVSADTNGVAKITVEGTNCNDIFNLNIPEGNGRITISNTDYEYDSFEATVNSDGTYSYEFTLKGKMEDSQIDSIQESCANGYKVLIGDELEYKGIPYYMARLNEFARTFSSQFNEVHNSGYDLDGNAGCDWFSSYDKQTNINYDFDETLGAGVDSAGKTFSSQAIPVYDSKGNITGYKPTSYYSMNAVNFGINKELLDNPRKIACMSTENGGVENNETLSKLVGLKSNNDMFKQGTPDAYLQTLISSVGIDCKQAKSYAESQSQILLAIDARRDSVSGVDKDEEAADLVKFQNLLFSQYKVLSIMNEVLNKLINGTAV